MTVPDSTVAPDQPADAVAPAEAAPVSPTTPSPAPDSGRAPFPQPVPMHRDNLSERLLLDVIDAVKGIVRKEKADRLGDVYLIGAIEKDTARAVIERLREL